MMNIDKSSITDIEFNDINRLSEDQEAISPNINDDEIIQEVSV